MKEEEKKKKKKTLEKVLLEEIPEFQVVCIYSGGWPAGMCWIDPEDLFIRFISTDFLTREVESVGRGMDEDLGKVVWRVDLA